MKNTENQISIIERLISGEPPEELIRAYPKEESLVRELAGLATSLRGMGESPERIQFEVALAKAREQNSMSRQAPFALFGRLAAPVLLMVLLLGGYGYSTLQKPDDLAFQSSSFESSPVPFQRDATTFNAKVAPESASMSMQATSVPSAKIFIAGDAMFDRAVRIAGERIGYEALLEGVFLATVGHEAIVFNLEGPVTAESSVSKGSAIGSPQNFVFTFAPEVLPALARMPVLLHLGNNHILNFGASGLQETQRRLKETGIPFFGAPRDAANKSALLTTSGGTLAFVSYNEFSPENERLATLAEIRKRVAEGHTTVVYAHWGDEYQTTSPDRIRVLAAEFVAAGARLIVGSHPHIVIPREEIEGIPVYFSLGNFIFDQYWMQGVRCGLALSVTLEGGTIVSIEELPVSMRKDGRTYGGEDAARDCAK